MSTEVICPTCGNKVVWSSDSPWRPFCTERCKLIDLGAWASEDHRIAGEEVFLNDEEETLYPPQ